MSEKNIKLNYLFTTLFITSIIYTTFKLFSLQDDLILSSQVLDSSQIASISPVLFQLYIAVGSVILSGIIVLAFSFKSESINNGITNITSDNNYTEDSKNSSSSNSDNNKAKLDVGFIIDALKNKKDKKEEFNIILNLICKKLELGQGAIYTPVEIKGVRYVEFNTGYAFSFAESETIKFEFGEGLIGQAAKEGETLVIDEIPDNYINIISGLGNASPKHLLILPILKGKTIQAVAEFASFNKFSNENIDLIKESFNILFKSVSEPSKTDNKGKEKIITKSNDEKSTKSESSAKNKKSGN
ncbi:MAG: GAF domain-containing protein [Cyclobacteriaceae bacterium]|nr:GAF domain-containing protein [Cyclobacteriaceae bacterium]